MSKHASKAKNTPSEKYVLVEFRTGVELVSSTWRTAKDKCWGPRHTKDLQQSYDDTVKNHVKPTEKWKTFKILRTFGTYDNFEVAQRKRQKALEVSDLDTEPEVNRPKNRNPRASNLSNDSDNHNQDFNSDESNEFTVEVGKIPVPISSRGVESSKNPTVTNTSVVSHIDDIETLSDGRMQIIKQLDNLQSTVDAQTLMLDRCLSFLQKIDRRVTTLTMSQGLDADEGVNEWQANLPLTSVQEVDDAETRLLGDKAKIKQLVCLLKKCGGTTVDDSIRRVLKEVFTNEVGTKYSWKGRRGKKNLSSMALTNAMYTAVQLVPEMTKEKFESRLKEWFRHAPARLLKETPPLPPLVPQEIVE